MQQLEPSEVLETDDEESAHDAGNQSQDVEGEPPTNSIQDVDQVGKSWEHRVRTVIRRLVRFLPFRKRGDTENMDSRAEAATTRPMVDIEAGQQDDGGPHPAL